MRTSMDNAELGSVIERIEHTAPSPDDWNRFFAQLVDVVEHPHEDDLRLPDALPPAR